MLKICMVQRQLESHAAFPVMPHFFDSGQYKLPERLLLRSFYEDTYSPRSCANAAGTGPKIWNSPSPSACASRAARRSAAAAASALLSPVSSILKNAEKGG